MIQHLHAARVDTFPDTVVQALACNTPVVAASQDSIPGLIQGGITGFLTLPGETMID
jgi:glycosyltransferase involved in cell wall biosynthesis